MVNPQSQNNHAYAPVLFKSEAQLLQVEAKLKENNIISRRYFYPSLDTLDYLKTDVIANATAVIASEARQTIKNSTLKIKHSHDIASRILCLPIYPGLVVEQQQKVISVIKALL